MSELNFEQDERLDAAMRTHLSAQLDPQRGRARLAFRRHVGLEVKDAPVAETALPLRYESSPSPAPTSVDRNPWWWRRGPWALAMVGSALAASLLTAWAAPVMWGGHAASGGSQGGGSLPIPSIQPTPVTRMDETVRSQVYDGGMYITPDGTPVRQLRRLNVHERNWQNETTGERVQQVVPSEDVMIYEMKTY